MGKLLETTLVCLFLIFLPVSKAGSISFFTETNYTGLVLQSSLSTECQNFADNGQHKIGSVQTDACVVLYQHQNCYKSANSEGVAPGNYSWFGNPTHFVFSFRAGKHLMLGSFHACNTQEQGIYSKKIRVKRGFKTDTGLGIFNFVLAPVVDAVFPDKRETNSANSCAWEGGCYRGYCWAGCDATIAYNEWCYTTRGYSQDFNYVSCTRDSECDKCWKCAGSCTQ